MFNIFIGNPKIYLHCECNECNISIMTKLGMIDSNLLIFKIKSPRNAVSKLLFSLVREKLTQQKLDSSIQRIGNASKSRNATSDSFGNFYAIFMFDPYLYYKGNSYVSTVDVI